MLEDIRKILGVHLEWHDDASCLFDIGSACKIANKYKIKLDLKGVDLEHPELYNFNKKDMELIKNNQNIKSFKS